MIFFGAKAEKSFTLRLANLERDTRSAARNGLYELGKDIISTVSKDMLQKPRSGRIYKHKGRRHVASNPGEAAANKSGAMRRSRDFKVRSWDQLRVGFGEDYAKFVEGGTKNMEPRPGMKRSILKNARNGKKAIQNEIMKKLTR